MNGNAPHQPAPPVPLHCILGFNLIIDRIAVMRLIAAVGELQRAPAQSISILISSPGGDPAQAFYAYEILKASPIKIITHNVGSIHSAAVPIFLAGSQRLAVEHSTFLMHKTVHTPAPGTSYGLDHLDYSGTSVQADDARAIAIIADRTGQKPEAVKEWFSGQKLRSTEFALKHGFIEKVAPVQFSAESKFFQITVG